MPFMVDNEKGKKKTVVLWPEQMLPRPRLNLSTETIVNANETKRRGPRIVVNKKVVYEHPVADDDQN